MKLDSNISVAYLLSLAINGNLSSTYKYMTWKEYYRLCLQFYLVPIQINPKPLTHRIELPYPSTPTSNSQTQINYSKDYGLAEMVTNLLGMCLLKTAITETFCTWTEIILALLDIAVTIFLGTYSCKMNSKQYGCGQADLLRDDSTKVVCFLEWLIFSVMKNKNHSTKQLLWSCVCDDS